MNFSCIADTVSQLNVLRFVLRMYFTISGVLMKLIFLTQHRKSVAWHYLACRTLKGTAMIISCWARIAAGIGWYSLLVVKEECILPFVPPFSWEMTIDTNLHPVNRGHHSGTGSSTSRRDASEASRNGVLILPGTTENGVIRSHPKSSEVKGVHVCRLN